MTFFFLVYLPVGGDPGPIRGRRPAVAEVALDRIIWPLFRHDRIPDRRRDRGFVQGLCRPVDPVLVPAVHNRLQPKQQDTSFRSVVEFATKSKLPIVARIVAVARLALVIGSFRYSW